MIKILLTLSIILSIAALSISTYFYLNPRNQYIDMGAATPKEVASQKPEFYDSGHTYIYDIESAHRAKHRTQIIDTLETVETSTSENYGITFYRYSIGTDVYRNAAWMGKLDDKWYWYQNLEYEDAPPTDPEWFQKMKTKKEQWEKESAKIKLD